LEASNQVKNLNETMVELEHELMQKISASRMYIKSKQESERFLKEEIVKLEEELKIAQATLVEPNAKSESKLITTQIKEKTSAVAVMRMKISEVFLKKEKSAIEEELEIARKTMVESNFLKKEEITIEEEFKVTQTIMPESTTKLEKSVRRELDDSKRCFCKTKVLVKNPKMTVVSLVTSEKEKTLSLMKSTLSEMKKKLDASNKDSFQAGSHIQNLKEKNLELEKKLRNSSLAAENNIKLKQELEKAHKISILWLEAELEKAKKIVALSANQLEKQLRSNEAITSAIKVKDNTLDLMQVKISEMKQEINVAKKDSIDTCSYVGHLKEKVTQLENVVKERTVSSDIHLQSKQEIERFLKRDIAKLQEELKIAQETVVSLTAKLEHGSPSYKSIESALEKKEEALISMELKMRNSMKELNTSRKECSQTSNQAKIFKKRNEELEKTAKDNVNSSKTINSALELEKTLKNKIVKLEEELTIAQTPIVSLTRNLQKEMDAKIAEILVNTEKLESNVEYLTNVSNMLSRKLRHKEKEIHYYEENRVATEAAINQTSMIDEREIVVLTMKSVAAELRGCLCAFENRSFEPKSLDTDLKKIILDLEGA